MKKFGLTIAILAVLVVAYVIADALLFDGIKPISVDEKGLQAQFFVKKNSTHNTAVILIGGGQWGDYWSHYFAKNDMAALSLPYAGGGKLPRLPEEIELEYFEEALRWLSARPEVDPDKIVVMGASRNAELALVLGATFPGQIHGVVGYAPSAVSWSNTVLPYNSDEIKASWTYQGKAIPFIAMDKPIGNATSNIDLLAYWNKGLADSAAVAQAAIPVERIQGPILLFSGKDDQVWPSTKMANMIGQRLETQGFAHDFQNHQYGNAGHMISGNPDDPSHFADRSMELEGETFSYKVGGTAEGDFKAKQQAREKLMLFLKQL
ncbi:acyl-CoA thioester hydrolase/BAAT C-terminal domain-containing protein [Flagellimonas sp. DF-77]|uniref:acyl-CoA thioester hydrolase/BAAT C-terminal domain-containing protein n=1 Tax=Flagellimonas algarum TaxID=3230298 RepID=UPI00339A8E4B